MASLSAASDSVARMAAAQPLSEPFDGDATSNGGASDAVSDAEVDGMTAEPPTDAAAGGEASSSAQAKVLSDADFAFLAGTLVSKLRVIPHHAITLRRNKYRVIRRVSK